MESLTSNNKAVLENLGNAVLATGNESKEEEPKKEAVDKKESENNTKQIEIIGNDASKLITNKNNNKSKKNNMPSNTSNLTKKRNNTGNTGNTSNSNKGNTSNEPTNASKQNTENQASNTKQSNDDDEPKQNAPDDTTEEDNENKPDLEDQTTDDITKDIADITQTANTKNNTAASKEINKEMLVSLNKLTMNLLNHQVVLKLFHFQTELYGAHKASDSYLETFASNMDKFLEVAQGIYGKITLKKFTLSGSSHNDENILKHLEGMVTLLREKINDILGEYTELINIRDELVGEIEQLKYLLTFK